MHSTRRILGSLVAGAVIGLVLVGCSGTSTASSSPTALPSPTVAPPTTSPSVAPPSESPTVAPTGPFALRSGALTPGPYTTTAFQPPLAFTLDAGWNGMFPDDDDEVALEGPGGIFFAISRVSKVVDPTSGLAVAAPEDLTDWFTTHPLLTVTTPNAVTVGTVSGDVLDVTVTNSSEIGIFGFPTGNLRIPAGVTYRCYVLPLEGPDMTIIIGAPDDGFADAVVFVQTLLDSLVIDAGG